MRGNPKHASPPAGLDGWLSMGGGSEGARAGKPAALSLVKRLDVWEPRRGRGRPPGSVAY